MKFTRASLVFFSYLSVFYSVSSYNILFFLVCFLWDFLIILKITRVTSRFFFSLLDFVFLKGILSLHLIKLIDFILQYLNLQVLSFWVEPESII